MSLVYQSSSSLNLLTPSNFSDTATFETSLKRVNELIEKRIRTIAELPVTSTKAAIENALRELPESLPKAGAGLEGMDRYSEPTDSALS